MPKYATSRDAKLRSIQGTIARSVIPVVQASAMLRASKAGPALQGPDFDAISTLCMDSVSMLVHANDQTNDFRHEIAKPTLKKKYQALCKLPKRKIIIPYVWSLTLRRFYKEMTPLSLVSRFLSRLSLRHRNSPVLCLLRPFYLPVSWSLRPNNLLGSWSLRPSLRNVRLRFHPNPDMEYIYQ